MDVLLYQAILNGILLGGIYIAISIGVSFAFGVMHLINVAQGELVMLGAFMSYWLYYFVGIDPIFTFPLVFAVFLAIGYVTQKTLVARVMGAPPLMNLVLFFGVSVALANSALLVWGPFARITTTQLSGTSFSLGGLTIPVDRALAFLFSLAMILALSVFLRRTRIGMGIVATAQDREAARLMGVDVERAWAITLGIGFGTAGMAGSLISSVLSVVPTMGGIYTLLAFFITVLGGMGYLPGTLAGGLLLGILQSLIITYQGTSMVYLVLFLILYLVLVFRPKGIFGKGM